MLAKDFHTNGQRAVRHAVHGIGIARSGPVEYGSGMNRARAFGDDFETEVWFDAELFEASDNRAATIKVPIAELEYLPHDEARSNDDKWKARKKAEWRSRVTEDAVMDLIPDGGLTIASTIADSLYIDPETCISQGILFVDRQSLDAGVVTRLLEKLMDAGRLERIKEKQLPNTVRVPGSMTSSWCYGHPGTIEKLQQRHVEIVDDQAARQARFEEAYLQLKALYPEGYADYDAGSRTSSVRIDLNTFLSLIEIAKEASTNA